MKKRVVAILVIIALLVTLFPVASFADTGDVEVFNKPYKLWGYRIRVYTNTTGSTDQGGYITDDQWGYLNIQGEWNFEAHHYDGYEFTGWTTSGSPSGAYQIDGNKLKIVKSGNENYHAYAHFNFVGYKVTLDLGNGGYFNSNNSSTITLENVPEGELDVPEYTIYDGYSFQGWDRSTNISSNETLHAGYEYEVTFEGNTNVTVTGASPVWTVNHAVSEPSYTVTDAPRFRFDGWDKSLSGISGPTTITANPAVERGYITLMITGHGNFAHRDAVQKWWDIGKKDLHLNNSGPYGDFGWIQTGWFNNNTGEKLPIGADVDVTGDCTYTAIFESLGSRYVNMFVLGSNGRLADNKSGTYQKGTVIDLNSANPVPTTAGYEFKYWEEYIDSSDSWKVVNENSDGEANITVGVVNEYRAVFGLTSHTVTYQDEAGVALGTETVTYGEDATASVLNLPAGSQIDESTDWRDQLADITGDKTVVVTLEYQVTFNLNGGTRTGGGELSQWVGYNEGAEEPRFDPPEGYDFTSWDNDEFDAVTTSLTITAQYAIKTYDITTSVTGGTITPSQVVNHGSDCTITYGEDTGYHLVSVTVDGEAKDIVANAGSYTFEDVTDDHTIDVVYEIDTFAITTSVTGGTITPDQTVNYNDDCEISYAPQGPGYHLVRVTVDGEDKDIATFANSYTFEDVKAPHTIDVEYEYRFVVKANASMVNGGIDVTYAGETRTLAPGASTTFKEVDGFDEVWFQGAPNAGYHFLKWHSSANPEFDNNGLRSRSIFIAQTFTPYADFEVTVYNIVYEQLGGGENAPGNPLTYTVEDDTITLGDATWDGYTFLGWAEGNTIPAGSTGTMTFTAQWSDPIVYSITYELGGGANDPGNPLTYTVEDAEITLADATWDGYTFLGWAEGNTIPAGSTGAKTFTAQWSDPIVYNITYELGGGDNAPGNPLTYTVEDAEITLSDATRDGYTFLGWAEGNTIPAGSTGAKTFTAQWSDAIVYDIAYDLAGGSVDGTNPVTYTVESDDITLINPELTGYTFTGWTGTGITDGTDTVVIPKGSIGHRSFTATYAINTFTVTFLDYDGVELGTDVVAYGGDAAAPADPTRTGYTFTGWNASLEGITEDVTVTAEYLLNTYTVTFVDYDGTEIDEQTIDWNEAADAPDDPAREGHTFAGWDTDFDAVTRNLTVTATYTINTFTVEFVDFDGTVLDTQTVDWNTAATAPDDPERDGYEFTGWDIDFDAVTENLTVRATYEEVTVLDEEPIPGTDDTTTLNDEGVPAAGGGGFPWWWIPIIGAAALALFLILFFWKRRKKDEEETV